MRFSTPPHARRERGRTRPHHSRGHRSPLPPRRRPAWTATQEVRRENAPCREPYQRVCQTGAALCRSACCLKGLTWPPRARRCPSTWSVRAGRIRAATDDVLRHLRRPHARRGPDRPPRRRPARARSTARRGRCSRAPRPPPPPRLFDEDLPDGFDLDDAIEMRALTPLARVRTRVAPARRSSTRPEDRRAPHGRDAHVRPHAASRPRGRHRRARLRPRTGGGRARPRRDAELARGDGRARRRGRGGQRPRPRGHEREAQLRARPGGARHRGRRDRLHAAAGDHRRQPPGHARGRRLGVPARPARRGPPLALPAAPVQVGLSRAPAAPPRRVQAPAGHHRRPARPRRLPARLPGPARLAPAADAGRPGPAAGPARDPPGTRADRHPPRPEGQAHPGRARRLDGRSSPSSSPPT